MSGQQHTGGQPWRERWARPGWRVAYTPLGGALRALDPATGLDPAAARAVARRTSQAFLAAPDPAGPAGEAVAFGVAVARKVLQRGHAPAVPPGYEQELLTPAARAAASRADAAAWLAAAIGPAPAVDLDPATGLDPVFEEPLWQRVRTQHPRLAPYLVPQAPLEALAPGADGHRWVDFLLAAPWLPRPAVLELDGAQHAGAGAVDAARDAALARAGLAVLRYPGPEALRPGGDLAARLAAAAAAHPGEPDPELTALAHGPATFTRLGMALVELLAGGHLDPGGVWDLTLEDPLGVAGAALPEVLGLLAALAATWSLDLVPAQVRAGGTTWHRDGLAYRPGPATGPAGRRARVLLEPFTPPHAALPDPRPELPTVVVRGAHLPAPLPWLESAPVPRRRVAADDPGVEGALEALARALFGVPGLRPGQLEGLRTTLTGRDALVLLPTGAGKSLVYQLAGLLQPGLTLVVAPIVSLIEDQQRRLRAEGVDRVAALHRDRVATAGGRDRAHARVASGEDLVVFLTPERLQNRSFRDALAAAAAGTGVNLAVVDEAHCVSEWGHDFRTAYLRLGRHLRTLTRAADGSAPALLALTGTASPAVLRDIVAELRAPGGDLVVHRPDSFDRPNLHYRVLAGDPRSWPQRLAAALAAAAPADAGGVPGGRGAGLVFVPHVNGAFGVREVADRVRAALPGARVGMYAGAAPAGAGADWDQRKRAAAAAFLAGDLDVLVATKSFGMGVDKPDVRWSVHLGFPSSIEAFVQEAGRAGRDGAPAHAVIVASPSEASRAAQLLDPRTPRQRRLALQRSGRVEDDLHRQLFFLGAAFPGVDAEFAHAAALAAPLLEAGPGARVALARTEHAAAQEKALYRLALLGLVEDYTVEHGAAAFTVDVAPFTPASLDAALLAFVDRVEPGKSRLRRRQLAQAPARTGPRVHHHLRMVLETLYAVVEPARLRALAEVHQLTVAGRDEATLRARVLAYLSDGPVAGVLADLAARPRLEVGAAVALLAATPAHDGALWAGAAARQLEAYPDHPVLLLVRALGEALAADPDPALLARDARDAFAALDAYDVPATDAVTLAGWAAEQLRVLAGGRAWPLVPVLLAAWDAAGRDPAALAPLEQAVLARTEPGACHPGELRAVLARRLARLVPAVAAATVHLTGDPAPGEEQR